MGTGRGAVIAIATFVIAGCGDDGGGAVDSGPPGPDFGVVADQGLVCDPPCGDEGNCCAGTCVDLDTDPDFCGSCETNCPSAQLCRGGFCVFPDDATTALDGGASDGGEGCVDSCDGGEPEDGGRSDAGEALDDGGLFADAAPDGGTLEVDAGPPVCTPSCPPSQRCCAEGCVNRTGFDASDESFDNCGACGFACDPDEADRCDVLVAGTPPACLCGTGLECPTGRVCVDDSCVDLQTDPNNCGSVGFACDEGERCEGGSCRCGSGPACGLIESCCDDVCVVVDEDPSNCGSCGNVCPQWATSCNGGTCGCGTGPACDSPVPGVFSSGDLGESCCGGVCVANTDSSCGCVACMGDDSCQAPGTGVQPEPEVCCGTATVPFVGCP